MRKIALLLSCLLVGCTSIRKPILEVRADEFASYLASSKSQPGWFKYKGLVKGRYVIEEYDWTYDTIAPFKRSIIVSAFEWDAYLLSKAEPKEPKSVERSP